MDISSLFLLFLKGYFFVWIAILVILLLLIHSLAKQQIIFTYCNEGRIIIVTKGENFHKVIYSIKGWRYNKAKDEFEEVEKEIGILEYLFGIHHIGPPFFYGVYKWPFQWSKLIQEDEDNADIKVKTRNEEVKSMIFQYPYVMSFKKMEIKGNIKVDIDILVTLQTISPYKSLFQTGNNWLQQVAGIIGSSIKAYMGKEDVNSMLTISGEKLQAFIKTIMDLNPEILSINGQKIVDVRLLAYDIEERVTGPIQAAEIAVLKGNADIAEAKQKVLVAEQRVQEAKKEAEKIGILADAEKDRLEKTVINTAKEIAKIGPDGVEVHKWIQMPDTGLINNIDNSNPNNRMPLIIQVPDGHKKKESTPEKDGPKK